MNFVLNISEKKKHDVHHKFIGFMGLFQFHAKFVTS